MGVRIKKAGEVVEFTVMCTDRPVAEVYISESKKEVNINRLVPDFIEQPFGGDKLDLKRAYRFLKSRCYEDGGADLKEILARADMSSNNPWEWVKIIHGATWENFFWIRFLGETLIWGDVRWR